jgi:uncharacterized protein YjiS (DUF1127 family)
MPLPMERHVMNAARDNPSPRRQSLVRRMYRRIVRSAEISRRKRMLGEMPDYLLKDIGINRSEIDAIVEAVVDGREDSTRRPQRFTA